MGFLINSPWVHRGFYTNPDIPLVLMKMCKDAGAKKIVCYKPVRDDYWEESKYYNESKTLIDDIIYGGDMVKIDIKGGKQMKSADVYKIYAFHIADVDVVILCELLVNIHDGDDSDRFIYITLKGVECNNKRRLETSIAILRDRMIRKYSSNKY